MSDDTDSGGFSWSAPSYGLGGNFQSSPGLSTGNLGDYSLGSGLGSVGAGGDNNTSFGGTHLSNSQQQEYLNNLYQNPQFSLSSLYGSIDSPLLGENEKVNWQNLNIAQEDLAKLPKIDLNTETEKKTPGWFEPGSMSYRLGLRAPGTEAARNFFGTETTAERDDRMGLIDKGLGTVANAVMGAVTPAPISLAMNGAKAYQEYQKTGDWKSALAKVLGGVGGYAGAAGQALQGNYGNAVTSALSKGGASPLASLVAGTGVDYSQGKDVTQNLGGIAGYSLGTAVGKGYGGLGQSLGRSLSSLYRK